MIKFIKMFNKHEKDPSIEVKGVIVSDSSEVVLANTFKDSSGWDLCSSLEVAYGIESSATDKVGVNFEMIPNKEYEVIIFPHYDFIMDSEVDGLNKCTTISELIEAAEGACSFLVIDEIN